MTKKIAIIGAGLTGLMCALKLAELGLSVVVYERRSEKEIGADKYKEFGLPGRSMSMDLSARGLFALNSLGLLDGIISEAVPMKWKISHDTFGYQHWLPYGQYDSEHILTVSRTHLFNVLLRACLSVAAIEIHFQHRLVDIDFDHKNIVVVDLISENTFVMSPELVIGADGINSAVRPQLEKHGVPKFCVAEFPMSYKELSLSPTNTTDFFLNAMHTWPREGMMLVAQPNLDGSFTCALLMHENGRHNSFNTVDSPRKVRQLFDEHFSDASSFMPNLEDEYALNPVGKLRIVTGSAWTHGGFALILGDAAHGMVPFFGQGVNCCFEDCIFLYDEIKRAGNDWAQVCRQVDERRVVQANSINTMSYENYPELFDGNDLPRVQLMKSIEAMLTKNYRGHYRSFHNLVCFERIPYTLAQRVKEIQMPMLERLSASIDDISEIDPLLIERELLEYQRKIAALDFVRVSEKLGGV